MPHAHIDEDGIAHTPGGVYSPAVVAGDMCFVSGQLPRDATTGQLVGGMVATQTGRALANLFAALHAAGFDRTELVSVTVLLQDIGDWDEMNEAYRGAFEGVLPPARIAFQAGVPHGARVEVQGTARRAAKAE